MKKYKQLLDRDVTLFPDLGAFEDWTQKASSFISKERQVSLKVSDFIETRANKEEIEQGYDLADYLVKYDWKLFRNNTPEQTQNEKGEKSEVTKEPSTNNELTKIAYEIIGEQNHLSQEQLLKHLTEDIFQLMVRDEIITYALPLEGHYFIKGSSPF